ncbi:hypothetical protein AY600_13905 [Phormidium willei BDU 130791]|nr:hypothetical protein AY600_13905 [Phormidium willei BDU 130791]
MSTPEATDLARLHYETAKEQFEMGQYRPAVTSLERASALIERASPLGGDIQIWLITAYQAVGDYPAALSLCRQLTRHPNWATRQQSRRLLAILEAPRLASRPEWNVSIPDLNSADLAEPSDRKGSNPSSPRRPKPRPIRQPEPIDPSQINRSDNQFIWFALISSLLILTALLGLS